jgi:hypothetical protein
LACLEDNQCTLNNDEKGSCGEQHCKDHLKWYTEGDTTCTTSYRDPYYLNAPSYRGYHETINSASNSAPSVLLLAAAIALIYALIH